MTERLFDHHTPPMFRLLAVLVPVFLEQTGLADPGDHRLEEPVGDSQVEQAVSAGIGRLLQALLQRLVKPVVAEIALDVGHAPGQVPPDIVLDLVDPAFARRLTDEAFHHLVQAVAPLVRVQVGQIDADQFECLRQQSGVRQIVQRRHQQSLGQVAARAENDHGAWPGRLSLPPRRGRHDLSAWIGRRRFRVCHA
ncbi:hypothetical protein GALL_502590 [mine drainage metagenome]|uniref:Uncharacterized protein n=1 Tax=mine drainage metagenome TaxID=410659 RepID=A0A1J5PA33_9ZZZZ